MGTNIKVVRWAISIHASYANDATSSFVRSCCFLVDFNPRIVRKRCDFTEEELDIMYDISIHASYANDATRLAGTWRSQFSFQSTHRTQTMRQIQIVIRFYGPVISIHASYANDATSWQSMSLLVWGISIHASYANDATRTGLNAEPEEVFQSTHRTQTMRLDKSAPPYHTIDFNPRIVRKRCDFGVNPKAEAYWNFNPRIVRKRCD